MAAFFDKDANAIATATISAPAASRLGHLLYPSIVITVLLSLYRLILNDYTAFLALGPGGTPSNFAGYLRVSYLRLFAISDPFQPPSLAKAIYPYHGYLHNIPKRSGQRPVVAGIAPQRQINQKGSSNLHKAIRQAYHTLVHSFPSLIYTGNSCFEKHGIALFLSAGAIAAVDGSTSLPFGSHLNPTCKDTGEICHLHASVSTFLTFLTTPSCAYPAEVNRMWHFDKLKPQQGFHCICD